ncbi:MAG: LysR family transcriptional regulator [Pigmentiphaga sp.]
MDLKQLSYFVTTVACGSMSRAAIQLGLSQPSLSRQIRLLEEELGDALFFRHGRGVKPTDIGVKLDEHARLILAQADKAMADIQNLKARPSGKVTVGIPSRLVRVIAPALLSTFNETMPNAVITIAEGLSSNLKEWLDDGRIDIALLYDPLGTLAHRAQLVWSESLNLMCLVGGAMALPKEVAFGDLPAYPLIAPSPPNTLRLVLDAYSRKLRVPLSIVAEANAVNSILSLIDQGKAYAVLSKSAVPADQTHRYQWAVIQQPTISNRLVLMGGKKSEQSRLVRETYRILKEMDYPALVLAP